MKKKHSTQQTTLAHTQNGDDDQRAFLFSPFQGFPLQRWFLLNAAFKLWASSLQCSESDPDDCIYDGLMMMTMDIIIEMIVGICIAEKWSGNLNLFAHKAMELYSF